MRDWRRYRNLMLQNVPRSLFVAFLGASLTAQPSDFGELHRVAGVIGGTVTASATGAKLSGIAVSAYRNGDEQWGYAESGSDGSYQITGLPPGEYYLTAADMSGVKHQGFLRQLYKETSLPLFVYGRYAAAHGTAVKVTNDETSAGIDFALLRGGTISGTLKDASTGAALVNHSVCTQMADGTMTGCTTTDSRGFYSVIGLPTGVYRVSTTEGSDEGYVPQVYKTGICPWPNCRAILGTPVSVTAGQESAAIDMALVKGGSITGTVRDAATGAPLANFVILSFDRSGAQGRAVATDARGTYSLDALPTGTYSLTIAPYLSGSRGLHGYRVTSTAGIEVVLGRTTAKIDFLLTK